VEYHLIVNKETQKDIIIIIFWYFKMEREKRLVRKENYREESFLNQKERWLMGGYKAEK
jgi:hypothetical protein